MQAADYKKLEELLKDKKEIAILTHSNPDPDAIGSALGMQLLLEEHFGIKSETFYSGQIAHPENKSLINLANIELSYIDSFDKEQYKNNVVLVDSAINDLVKNPLAVIDHHKLEKDKVKAHFKYIKHAGACATLILDLLSYYGIKLDSQKHKAVITAMVHGLRSDTDKLTINVTADDINAYLALHELVDYELIRKIEHPPKTQANLGVLADAIKNKEIKASYLISGVGVTEEGDAIPETADYLLCLSGIETTIIYGVVDNHIRASIRTKDPTVNAAELVKAIFGNAVAGGKTNASGAYIPLTFFDLPDLTDELYALVSKTTLAKFYKAIKTKKDEK